MKQLVTTQGLGRAGAVLLIMVAAIFAFLTIVWVGLLVVEMGDQLIDPPVDEVELGMPRSEVESLLGADDPTNREGFWPEDALVYEMGCWIDCTWTIIHFDAQDRVERIEEYMD